MDRRWPWYSQIVDALFAIAGLALVGVMAVRDSYPLPGVFLVLVFAGRVTTSTLQRYLIGRWDEREKS